MNKYQEALDELSYPLDDSSCGGCKCGESDCSCEKRIAIETLQELVELATPKKPIDRTKYEDRSNGFFEYHGETLRDIRCPNCNKRIRLVHKYKHCAKCGQALKWSDE